MNGYRYDLHLDDPRMMAVCETCDKDDCSGLCRRYRERWRELFGKPLKGRRSYVTRHGRTEPKKEKLGAYKKPLEAFGETHDLATWARMYGIPYRVMYQRLYRGSKTLEAALMMGRREGRMYAEPVRYEYKGEALSIREWSERTGVHEQTIRGRLGRGLPMELVLKVVDE